MTAKEYLRQYSIADRKAKRLHNEYEREQELIDAIRSPMDFDGMPRSTNWDRRSVEDKVMRLVDKQAAWKIAEIEALQIRQQVFETISGIKGDEGEVLFLRYISLKRWEEIAIEMNYSWSGIHKLHRKALHIVAESIGE